MTFTHIFSWTALLCYDFEIQPQKYTEKSILSRAYRATTFHIVPNGKTPLFSTNSKKTNDYQRISGKKTDLSADNRTKYADK